MRSGLHIPQGAVLLRARAGMGVAQRHRMILILLAVLPWQMQVHIDADQPGVELRAAEDDALVCAAPCDRALPYDSRLQFVLAGERVARSDPFSFAQPGPVSLTVHAGPQEWASAGKVSLVLGVLGIFGGSLAETLAINQDLEVFNYN